MKGAIPIVAVILFVLMIAVTGCVSNQTSSPQVAGSESPSDSASASASAAKTVTTATPTSTPTQTPGTSKVATTTQVWAPPVIGPDTIANPGPSMGAYIAQGSDGWYCRAVVNAADGTHPCGKANWYIDNQAAGGVWSNNAPGVNGLPGCSEGMGGGFAMLELHSADTLKLSIGYHTLKCDFLGDSKYAPSEWGGRIYIGPTSTPAPSLTPTPTTTPICNCNGPDLNCANFATHADAQACYNYCKSLGKGDVFGLDGDNDGSACEDLP
jgi:hypothetical protein